MLVGYIMLGVSTELYEFYIGRFLCGISCGGLMTVVPLYVGEIAENHNRGKLGCFMPLIINMGRIFSFAIGPNVSIITLGLTSAIAPLLFLILFALLVPESPYYLLSQSDGEAARTSFRKFRRYDNEESNEFLEISDAIEKSSKPLDRGLKDILKNKAIVKSTVITVGLFVFQQLSGLSVILGYSQTIFQATGSSIPPEMSSILIGIMQLVGCILATAVVDKIGRRILLLLSSAGNATSLITLGLYFHLHDVGVSLDGFQWIPTTSVIIFMITFSVGVGPVPITLVGELFPSNAKSAASTLTIVVGLFTGFCALKFFLPSMVFIGTAPSFWIFSAMCVVCLIFIYAVVPETKERSFQEIQDLLNK